MQAMKNIQRQTTLSSLPRIHTPLNTCFIFAGAGVIEKQRMANTAPLTNILLKAAPNATETLRDSPEMLYRKKRMHQPYDYRKPDLY